MFRISQYMRELAAAQAKGIYPEPARRNSQGLSLGKPSDASDIGPVVIWNLIRRCNLTCKHCYALSADHEYPNELTTEQVYAVMQDLKDFQVPVLILSGGEPLIRQDIFQIAERAKAMGFYVGLSTNGTLIDAAMAERIAATGFNYVGISLDGLRDTHDKFRRLPGAFDRSLTAVRLLEKIGVKVGLRFTMTALNAHDLPSLLDLMREERVQKFYFSHLNYAGRGNIHREKDAHVVANKLAMDLLFDRAWEAAVNGWDEEYVTGNNDADAVWLLRWVAQRLPQWVDHLQDRLVAWGGNSSGVGIANIDNLGHVHPDTMWWHYDLGSVKERPFSEIWQDLRDPVMAGLRSKPRPVTGRCATCHYRTICGGNTRVRAMQLTGDVWAEDPGCYLSDSEIQSTPVTACVAA